MQLNILLIRKKVCVIRNFTILTNVNAHSIIRGTKLKSVDERFQIWPGTLAADVRHGDKQEGRHFLRRFEHRIPNCTPRRHGPPLRSRCC